MAYQVLARKWRPSRFSELVGQEHVVAAITNGLENNRLHHAYLFTGTRGVGKTTIARIFSKSLNCETGMGANPCGKCHTCKEIENGSFVDLLEIDAASRTKVEDTREILDNVQYKPTRGEYKVYLIDEVHMLSKHSFNALLKTLEEPPPHVKFLLATTDPQKLPVTILSRCLQFNLKALSRDQIATQLDFVLSQESLSFEPKALAQIARAAQGSMRDALSLTDQAIAQGNGVVSDAVVSDMLGLMDKNQVLKLVHSVFSNNAEQVMDLVEELSQQSANLEQVLVEIMSLLHQVALTQFVPDACKLETVAARAVFQLAKMLPSEQVQLVYQIALQGKKDINFAADARIGLEMTLLRMLAFNPAPLTLDIDETNQIAQQSSNLGVSAKAQEIPNQPAQQESDFQHSEGQLETNTLSTLSSEQDDILKQAAAISPHHGHEHSENNVASQTPQNFPSPEEISADENHWQQDSDLDSHNEPFAQEHVQPNKIPNAIDDAALGHEDLSQPASHAASSAHSTQSLIALKNQLAQKDIASEVASDKVKKSDQDFSPQRFTGASPHITNSLGEDSEPASAGPQFSNKDEHEGVTATQIVENQEQPIKQSYQDEHDNDVRDNTVNVESASFAPQEETPPWDHQSRPSDMTASDHSASQNQIDENPSFDPMAHLSETTDVAIDFEVPAFLDNGEKVIEARQLDTWSQLIEQMPIAALTKQLALHSSYEKNAGEVTLKLLKTKPHLDTELARGQLEKALSEMFNEQIELNVEHGQPINTPFAVQQAINQIRLSHAKHIANTNENIQRLKATFAGEIVEHSIQPR